MSTRRQFPTDYAAQRPRRLRNIPQVLCVTRTASSLLLHAGNALLLEMLLVISNTTLQKIIRIGLSTDIFGEFSLF